MYITEDEVYASGTLGDALFILLKVVGTPVRKINHFSAHKSAYPLIKQIYSMCPHISVTMLDKKTPARYVTGHLRDYELYTAYPSLHLSHRYEGKLPYNFNVLQLKSGLNDPARRLSIKDIANLEKSQTYVLIGTDKMPLEMLQGYDILDLRNKTSLIECFSIIARAQRFYGPQGLMAFFALSQKVKSYIYLKTESDRVAVNARIKKVTEWKDYVTLIGYERGYR